MNTIDRNSLIRTSNIGGVAASFSGVSGSYPDQIEQHYKLHENIEQHLLPMKPTTCPEFPWISIINKIY